MASSVVARVERVVAGLEHLWQLAGPESRTYGVNRLAFTQEEIVARKWFQKEAQAAGLQTQIDPFGNVFVWSERPTTEHPAIAVGSHLDSIPNGGNYDGALGALCALEVVRAIHESGLRAVRPVVAIAFAAEESVRFGKGCLGSAAIVGSLSTRELLSLSDSSGTTVQQALEGAGLVPTQLEQAQRRLGWATAFLEVHIDQGPTLREAGVPIGIVTAISGPVRHRLVFVGQAMHSGAAPMAVRRDALAGAAELVVAVEALGRTHAEQGVVTTVGQVQVEPGFMTVVPGRVTLGIDVRGPDRAETWAVWDSIWAAAQNISQKRNLTVSKQSVFELDPVRVPGTMMELLAKTCKELGVRYTRMPSGSGHDAMNMAQQMDIGMLFVRNRAGVSHEPSEFSSPEDINSVLQVLLGTIWELANQPYES